MARSAPERAQPRDQPAGPLVQDRGPRLDAADAGVVRIDADCLGRSHLSQRRRRARACFSGPSIARTAPCVEAALRRRQQADPQAEHVVAVAGDRRHSRVGDDRHRRPQGVRLRRQRTVDARHPARLRARSGSSTATDRRRCCSRIHSTCRCCTDRTPPIRRTSLRINKTDGKTIWRVERPHHRAAGVAGCLHDAHARPRRHDGTRSSSPARTSSPATIRRPARSCGEPKG